MSNWLRRGLLGCFASIGIVALSLPAAAEQGMPHGNHDPHHGGVVLMYGMDLHFEIVLRVTGAIRIYFTDGQRVDLPAAFASDIALEIERPGGKSETVAMAIGKTGECWEGKSAPINAADATLHLAFVIQGNPIIMSFPAASLMVGGNTVGANTVAGKTAADSEVAEPASKDTLQRGQ
jgi:hypothetical protein